MPLDKDLADILGPVSTMHVEQYADAEYQRVMAKSKARYLKELAGSPGFFETQNKLLHDVMAEDGQRYEREMEFWNKARFRFDFWEHMSWKVREDVGDGKGMKVEAHAGVFEKHYTKVVTEDFSKRYQGKAFKDLPELAQKQCAKSIESKYTDAEIRLERYLSEKHEFAHERARLEIERLQADHEELKLQLRALERKEKQLRKIIYDKTSPGLKENPHKIVADSQLPIIEHEMSVIGSILKSPERARQLTKAQLRYDPERTITLTPDPKGPGGPGGLPFVLERGDSSPPHLRIVDATFIRPANDNNGNGEPKTWDMHKVSPMINPNILWDGALEADHSTPPATPHNKPGAKPEIQHGQPKPTDPVKHKPFKPPLIPPRGK